MNNDLMARVIFHYQLATKEQILAAWPYIGPMKDVGRILLEQGVVGSDAYGKLVHYIKQLEENTGARVEEPKIGTNAHIWGTANPSRSSGNDHGQEAGPTPRIERRGQGVPPISADQAPALQSYDRPLRKEDPEPGDWEFPDHFQEPEPPPTAAAEAEGDLFQEMTGGDWDWEGPEETNELLPNDTLNDGPLPGSQPSLEPMVPMSEAPLGGGTASISTLPPVVGASDEDSHGPALPADFIGDAGWGTLESAPQQTMVNSLSLDEILVTARSWGVSDVHICSGSPIKVRHGGLLQPATESPLSQADIERLMREALAREGVDPEKIHDREWVYSIRGSGRYRMTFMRHRAGRDLTVRVVPMQVSLPEDLGLPPAILELTKWAQGLVLVTGPAGSGKTTTLCALVEAINETRRDHIITVEDPVEIVFDAKECQITQRQVGLHTQSQQKALRAALREDPDILVVGELRDPESIQLAVSAAETGHLVFGTMNTSNASRTIYRLIESFPPEDQGTIRSMVSDSLRGVISQQLIPRMDGQGMVAAFEVLLVNSAVANLIRKEELHQLGTAMITGKGSGMVLLDDSLKSLVQQKIISAEEAAFRATTPKNFEGPQGRG